MADMTKWYKLLYNFNRFTLPGIFPTVFFQTADFDQLDEDLDQHKKRNRLAQKNLRTDSLW